uniref:Tudor domain-containing protein n=1 Tax=Lotharella oceanica TaxID=641309 RepID=A0A7S2XGB6_9EUKA
MPKRKMGLMSEAFWTSLKRMKYDIIMECAEDKFKEGSRCDVLDYHMGREVWRTCRVLRCDAKQEAVFVHWEGWGHHWDEWIDLRLGRRVIAPLYTHVPRLARTGKQCEFFVPLSLGVAVAGGSLERLTRRGSAFFPAASTVLSTCLDNQNAALVCVYQGDRRKAEENRLLGEFTIRDLPSAAQGELQIVITATLHPDGLLAVRAQCEKANLLAGFDMLLNLPGDDPNRFGEATRLAENPETPVVPPSELGGGQQFPGLSEEQTGPGLSEAQQEESKAESATSSSGSKDEDKLLMRKKEETFLPPNPWEDRKCRCWAISNALLPILGSDVTELIDQFDDLLRWSLCKAPSGSIGAQEGLTALDLDGDDDEDDEEDVALVAPALLPRF